MSDRKPGGRARWGCAGGIVSRVGQPGDSPVLVKGGRETWLWSRAAPAQADWGYLALDWHSHSQAQLAVRHHITVSQLNWNINTITNLSSPRHPLSPRHPGQTQQVRALVRLNPSEVALPLVWSGAGFQVWKWTSGATAQLISSKETGSPDPWLPITSNKQREAVKDHLYLCFLLSLSLSLSLSLGSKKTGTKSIAVVLSCLSVEQGALATVSRTHGKVK